jgi:hypothetical protein
VFLGFVDGADDRKNPGRIHAEILHRLRGSFRNTGQGIPETRGRQIDRALSATGHGHDHGVCPEQPETMHARR